MQFFYKFSAVKGIQAKKEYYIAMVPLNVLGKIFSADESIQIPPEYRSQRRINESRIPIISSYMLENRDTYVFSALSASINGDFRFTPSIIDDNVGELEIDMNATFLINDGQHRKAAIEIAIKEDESLQNETISIVFFKDMGLKRSQQMFTDLNKHAVKTSNSLSTLYDSRDSLAVATIRIIDQIPFFRKYTDKEKDNLGKNSSNLFTLNNLYKANQKVLHSRSCGKEDEEFLLMYWKKVSENIVEWNELLNRQLTKKDLRENYIITLAITMLALGKLGSYFYENKDFSMNNLENLRTIDWLRSNRCDWENRVIRDNGRVLGNEESVLLLSSKIKQLIGIELNREEMEKEKVFKRKMK